MYFQVSIPNEMIKNLNFSVENTHVFYLGSSGIEFRIIRISVKRVIVTQVLMFSLTKTYQTNFLRHKWQMFLFVNFLKLGFVRILAPA